MKVERPRRLAGVSYVGYQRYFLTMCTAFRRRVFVIESDVSPVVGQFLHTATLFDFAVVAYVVMPDHLHGLVVGQSGCSDLPAFVKRFKQLTGFAYRKAHHQPLWQPSFHERILRNDEASEAVARYILENPVRAGLSQALGEYPFAGSQVYSNEELLTAWEAKRQA